MSKSNNKSNKPMAHQSMVALAMLPFFIAAIALIIPILSVLWILFSTVGGFIGTIGCMMIIGLVLGFIVDVFAP